MKLQASPIQLPSLLRRILDALFAPFRPLELPTRTDAEALASDRQAVGDDLRQAMAKFESEIKNGN